MMKPISIIENTESARDKHGYAWGGGDFVLNKKQFKALEDGKCVALFVCDEYVTFLSLKKPEQ